MGEHLRIREASERANASIEAIKEMAPHVSNHSMMLNTLSQAVYELVGRLSAMEVVVSRYLEQQGTTFSQLLVEHIAEQQQAENVTNDDDEGTDNPAAAEPEDQTTDS